MAASVAWAVRMWLEGVLMQDSSNVASCSLDAHISCTVQYMLASMGRASCIAQPRHKSEFHGTNFMHAWTELDAWHSHERLTKCTMWPDYFSPVLAMPLAALLWAFTEIDDFTWATGLPQALFITSLTCVTGLLQYPDCLITFHGLLALIHSCQHRRQG